MNGDGLVNVVDVGLFGVSFPFPDATDPNQAYDFCADFNCDQRVDVIDVGILGLHWPSPADPTNHDCTP